MEAAVSGEWTPFISPLNDECVSSCTPLPKLRQANTHLISPLLSQNVLASHSFLTTNYDCTCSHVYVCVWTCVDSLYFQRTRINYLISSFSFISLSPHLSPQLTHYSHSHKHSYHRHVTLFRLMCCCLLSLFRSIVPLSFTHPLPPLFPLPYITSSYHHNHTSSFSQIITTLHTHHHLNFTHIFLLYLLSFHSYTFSLILLSLSQM